MSEQRRDESEQPQKAEPPPEERGDRPMLAETPTLEVAGRTYTMRPLGYADHGRLAAILEAAVRQGKVDLAAVALRGDAEEQTKTIISLLLAAFGDAQAEMFDLLASVLGVSRQTLLDPEVFPFASLPLVLRKLFEHPDLTDFFVEIGALIEGRPTLTPPSNGRSTSSPNGTDTRTNTS